MTRATRLIGPPLVLLLIAVGVLATPGPALACDCPEPPPPQEALSEAAAVFAGEVSEIEVVGDGPPGPWHHARVEVSEVWTGEVHEVEAVRTHADQATCGYEFVEGRAELVYAQIDDEDRLTTNLCSRTTSLESANEDLAALGEGDAPRVGHGPGAEPGQPVGFEAWALVVAGVVVLAVVALLVARRRRRRPAP